MKARARGRRLRAESTPEEQKLWRHLRAKRFAGFKFRRQHRIGPYFAEQEEQKDTGKTAYLNEQGYRVVRFWNEQVRAETDDMLEASYVALTDS